MIKLSRATALTSAAMLYVVAFAGSAFGATAVISDPAGDTPDIRKLTLDNRQANAVLKQKYADIELVQVESLYLKWGETPHYRVNVGNYDEDPALETRLWYVTSNGDALRNCAGMTLSRAADTDLTTVVVPRTCIPRAPDRLRAKGVASMGVNMSDATALTPWAARG